VKPERAGRRNGDRASGRIHSEVVEEKATPAPASDPRYASLTFFDPDAPVYPAWDVRAYLHEPAGLTAPPPVEASGRCSECGWDTMQADVYLRHDYWCSWWNTPEGRAAKAPKEGV